jgi:hypothetical protein
VTFTFTSIFLNYASLKSYEEKFIKVQERDVTERTTSLDGHVTTDAYFAITIKYKIIYDK